MGDYYGATGMGLFRIFGFCAAFLFASSVAAANIIDLGPSDYKNFGPNGSHTTSGVRSSFGQTVRMPPPSANSLTVTRNPVIPYGSIANGAKSFARINPQSVAASAALTAIMLGLDWVFDEELDSWAKPDIETTYEDGYIGWHYSANPRGEPLFATPYEAALAGLPSYACCDYELTTAPVANGPTQAVGEYSQTRKSNGEVTYFPIYIYRHGSACPDGYTYNENLMACSRTGLLPLDDSDFNRLASELPNFPANQVAGAASDIQSRQGSPLPGYQDTQIAGPSSVSGPETTTTSTDPVTGDTIITTTNTTTNISYGDTTITTTNTTTSTTYQNGEQTGETITTETPGELPVSSGGGAGDWPGFCEWASVVCDWFNWTQEEPPPEQDLPAVVDDDFYQEKTISFGSKSCPPDHQIDLTPFLSTSVAVSFQPLCDFAGLIYYMVMAASYIIAAYITIGVARNG